MKIAVCLKQVPDPIAGPAAHDGQAPWVTNESDLCALELALGLAASNHGSVHAIALGPDRVTDVLRRALALGAASAVRVDTPDPLLDARPRATALAAAVRQLGCDLVLCGAQSSWVGSGTTPGWIAATLGWPCAWLVLAAAPAAAEPRPRLRVRRELEGGCFECSELDPPCVLAVQVGAATPRLVPVRALLQAKQRVIPALDAAALGLVGEGGDWAVNPSCTLAETRAPTRRNSVTWFDGPVPAAAANLLAALRADGLIGE